MRIKKKDLTRVFTGSCFVITLAACIPVWTLYCWACLVIGYKLTSSTNLNTFCRAGGNLLFSSFSSSNEVLKAVAA